MAESDRQVLPTTVLPSEYDLHLTPDLEAFTFAGHVDIGISVKTATSEITLHGLALTIHSAVFCHAKTQGKTPASDTVYDKDNETITFKFPAPLPLGDHLLTVDYQGELNDKMCGFYRSTYELNGEQRIMGVTQFEPADARRALPCWDEPLHKAVFKVTLTIPSNRMALSNMPALSDTEKDGKRTLKFDATPKMSTYLLAFVVGEFEHVEGATKDGVAVRVYTPIGKTAQGKFALDVGIRVLEFFTDYFDIAYPLPKADMIAIPDFSAGAMENWGLITYRETALLVDEKNSPLSSKQRVAYVVAHELAHQWFGNLVTPVWWTHLWLNEGFATWIGNLAVDVLFPEWDIWTTFVNQYVCGALHKDSNYNSHAIEVDVKKSSELNEIFDAISYSKGASVIRMIQDYLGADAFKKGLRIYLKRHQFGNAVTEDLWKALEEASGRDVTTFMSAWTRRVGYPYVSVEPAGPDAYSLSQARFFSSREYAAKKEPCDPWWIHMDIRSGPGDAVKQIDMKASSEQVSLPELSAGDWIKFNAGQAGFYRMMYPDNLFDRLVEAVRVGNLPTIDRIGLENDAFALARAGLTSTARALKLACAYEDEENYVVWSDLTSNLDMVRGVWESEPCFPALQNLVRKLYTKIAGKLGWDASAGEPPLHALLRPIVLDKLASVGDEAIVAEANRRFQDHVSKKAEVVPNLRALVYKTVISNGGEREFEQMLELYRTAPMHEEKVRLLRSLGYTKNPDLVQRALRFSLSEEVRPQDTFVVFASTASRAASRDLTWTFMKENWAKIFGMFGEGQFLMARMISLATSQFVSNEKADEIEQFFKANPVPNSLRTIRQSLEDIRSNAAWLASDRDDVAKFLKDY